MSRRNKILIGVGLYLLIGILLYVLLGDEGKNDEFKPQNEFKLDTWISLQIGPLDMSINKAVLYLFMGSALTIATWLYIANRMQARPNRVQTAVETLYQLMKNNIAEGNMDRAHGGASGSRLIGTLFLFIWFANLIGYIPLPDQHRAQGRHLRAAAPVLRPVRSDREHLDTAGADADGLVPATTTRASGRRASSPT